MIRKAEVSASIITCQLRGGQRVVGECVEDSDVLDERAIGRRPSIVRLAIVPATAQEKDDDILERLRLVSPPATPGEHEELQFRIGKIRQPAFSTRQQLIFIIDRVFLAAAYTAIAICAHYFHELASIPFALASFVVVFRTLNDDVRSIESRFGQSDFKDSIPSLASLLTSGSALRCIDSTLIPRADFESLGDAEYR